MEILPNDCVRRTQELYDRIGHLFDAETDAFNRAVAFPQVIRILTEELQGLGGKSILDIGCGSGRLVKLMLDEGADAEGIELSRATAERRGGLPVACGSMLDLPYPDGTFDAAVAYHSFNYLPSGMQPDALSEMHRVLRPEGTLVLGAFHAETRQVDPVTLVAHGESFPLFLRTKDELERMLGDAGFFCLRSLSPVCTPDECLLVESTKRHLVADRPYAQFMIAVRV
jgi:SAM-dependent methyltransferase